MSKPYVPSIEERLLAAIHGITLIRVGINAEADVAGLDSEDVTAALAPLALDIREHLYWP